jgi:hypothetical protein
MKRGRKLPYSDQIRAYYQQNAPSWPDIPRLVLIVLPYSKTGRRASSGAYRLLQAAYRPLHSLGTKPRIKI